jgi:hypothetical protein
MKIITIFSALFLIVVATYFTFKHYWVVSRLSVQENIVDANGVYSWEEWCQFQHPDKSITKKKIATFSVAGEFRSHGQLTTDICLHRSFLQ